MTYKEAIERLKGRRMTSSMWATFDDRNKENEALDMAIEALEKQIPKKPAYCYERDEFYFDWKCPNCGRVFVNATIGVNHCCDCGQKISWEEE